MVDRSLENSSETAHGTPSGAPPSALHSLLVELSDLEAGVRDYARLLGQAPDRIESNPRCSTRSAIFQLENTALELRAAPVAADPLGDPGRADRAGAGRPGLSAIRLTCEQADPRAALAERGVGLAVSLDEQAVTESGLAVRRWRTHRIDPAASRGLTVELVCEETLDPSRSQAAPDRSSSGGDPERAAVSAVDPAARVRRLDHVVVFSADPDATRAFYADGLGLRLALDRTFEERGVRLLFFRIGGTTLEIGARIGSEPRPDREDRFGGLAWQVVDLEAIRTRLLRDGFDVSEIRTGHKAGTRVCTVRSPVHDVPTLLIEPVA